MGGSVNLGTLAVSMPVPHLWPSRGTTGDNNLGNSVARLSGKRGRSRRLHRPGAGGHSMPIQQRLLPSVHLEMTRKTEVPPGQGGSAEDEIVMWFCIALQLPPPPCCKK